ncbi:hypothetical protein EVAR_32130_1 [Eumeta japonica]|uniref:Uncharacterized protein n=1 Tax=Eumeta variegata TaxID=151549 RepID=A0A4C1V5T9_EUMVA|nr:hypothetical protein EVAR_32130_1 [Eumeta japonica]
MMNVSLNTRNPARRQRVGGSAARQRRQRRRPRAVVVQSAFVSRRELVGRSAGDARAVSRVRGRGRDAGPRAVGRLAHQGARLHQLLHIRDILRGVRGDRAHGAAAAGAAARRRRALPLQRRRPGERRSDV